MKKIASQLILISLFSVLFIYGCTKGKGEIVVQYFSPETFSKIELNISGELILVADQNQFIEVHSHQNIIDILKIETQSGRLIIKTQPGKKIGKFDELTFYVHTPAIEAITNSASGNISGGDSVEATSLVLKTSASGNINITGINCQSIDAKASASGNIKLSGSAENATFDVSGSGGISAFDLTALNTIAKTSSSGNIETSTVNNLNAKITGSGNIFYKGNPTITTEDNSSGSLINSN